MNLSKGYLLAIVAVLTVLSLMLVLPFLQYVLGAILLAYVLSPVHRRLAPRVGERISAGALLVLALVGLAVPFVLMMRTVVSGADQVLGGLEDGSLEIETIESRIAEYTGLDVSISDAVSGSGQEVGMQVLGRTPGLLETAIHSAIGIGLALFLIYYFLKDGDQFMAWLRETTPLPDRVQRDLYAEIDDVLRATLLGHVFIAVIQGVIAGLGLVATGIPSAAFWTFVMVILAILPLIGAFLVWGPASVYLAATGDPILGVALFVYGTVVVGLTDDYLRPVVVDRYAELNPAVIILGVLGGVYAFGVMGLFFGPVIIGALKACLTVVTEHYGELEEYETGA